MANKAVSSEQLNNVLTRINSALSKLDAKNFGGIDIDGRTLKLFPTSDISGTPIKSVTLPSDLRLDQAKTTFAPSFTFNSSTYAGATNPNLNGKPVLILTVTDGTNSTYSFLNLEGLLKTYSPLNNGIQISGSSIGAKVSGDTDNLLSIAADGLLVGHDDDKVDKVPSATQGNIAIFGASGVITDSGFSFATDAEITAMLNSVFGS